MTSSDPTTIRCIYCREVRPPSREHVLPRSLGGDLVQLIICKDCNTRRLSPLDQALAERSPVALTRVASTPDDAFGAQLGGDHFSRDEASGLMLEVAVTNGMQAVVLPQVHAAPVGVSTQIAIVTADVMDLHRLNAFVAKQIENGKLRTMHVKLGPADAGPTARLVLHRESTGFVRAQTDADVRVLFDVLESNWSSLYAQHAANVANGDQPVAVQSIERPWVKLNVAVRPDDVNRAVAKIAFNLLAVRLGSAFALSQEFDELRRYVLGEDVRHREHLGPGEIAIDSRFVTQLPHGTRPLIPTEEHAVILACAHPTMYAWVTLYKSHNFVVKLGEINLSETVLAVHEFSSVRKGNQALEVAEAYRRMVTQQGLDGQ